MIQQERQTREEEAFESRLRERRQEISPLYATLIAEHIPTAGIPFMPNAHDVLRLPSLAGLLKDEDARVPVTADCVARLQQQPLEDSKAHAEMVKRDLAEMAHRARQRKGEEPMMQVIQQGSKKS